MSEYAKYVEKHRELIFDALDYIWANPETGFREWKTHAYLEEQYAKLGYVLTLAGDIPGFVAEVDTGKEGPTVAVFGEMDAILCPKHPNADPLTGASHSCGHCAQSAALLGLAAALKEEGALDGLCGKIRLVAVPAEELVELEFREELQRNGVIKYLGGKAEFIWRGLLDGVDMAFMIHTRINDVKKTSINRGSNGCIVKKAIFEGVAAHAGSSPHKGVNALYAANVAIDAANALRETFVDDEHVRYHPIIIHGGDSVNAVPDKVIIETQVRGSTMESIIKNNKKINRAMAAAAASMGANVRLVDLPGYTVRNYPDDFCKTFVTAAEKVMDIVEYTDEWAAGCSDMGEVGAIMPMLHPGISGSSGTSHGSDYFVTDRETACIKSAEVQFALLAELLKDEAKNAKQIIANYKPLFATKQEYFDFVDKMNMDKQAVIYEEGRTILDF